LRAGLPEGSPEEEAHGIVVESSALLESLEECPDRFRRCVDWAAKRWSLDEFAAAEGPRSLDQLRSIDLEYHSIEADQGLYFAMAKLGEAEAPLPSDEVQSRLKNCAEPTRARARGIAVKRFGAQLTSVSWGRITAKVDGKRREVSLDPDVQYDGGLEDSTDVHEFFERLKG
jgi:proteasome accessory factor A